MKESITIFCDGASKGNPGPGGWGAIVSYNDTIEELGGYEARTTNNKMELRAAVEALSIAQKSPKLNVMIYTDSSYVINGITKWVHGWQKNGWLTKDKKPVANQELWEALLNAVQKFEQVLDWQYVGGHVGIAGNERVDTIASDFALGKAVVLYKGDIKNYTVDIANISFDEAKQKEKSSQSNRSKAKAYSYVSMVDGKVLTHKTWAECEARVKGKKARFKKALSAEEENK